jgi:hypothetical protein
MTHIAGVTTKKVMKLLATGNGVPAAVAAMTSGTGLAVPPITATQIIAQNVAPDVAEQSVVSKYPLIYVYCNKMVNELKEKFRRFSGDAQMVAEVRVSQDRLDDIETNLQVYLDAVTLVLDNNRGDWGDGVVYGGGYEVTFGGVKHGGRNFIQIAKVSFAVDISTD